MLEPVSKPAKVEFPGPSLTGFPGPLLTLRVSSSLAYASGFLVPRLRFGFPRVLQLLLVTLVFAGWFDLVNGD